LWVMSIIGMCLFLIFILEEIEQILKGKPYKEIIYKEKGGEFHRAKIMTDNSLTLCEKLIDIELNRSDNTRVIAFRITPTEKVKSNNSIKSLYIDDDIMKINKQKQILWKYGDTISIEIQNGDNINLTPYQDRQHESEYLKLIGYLSNEDFFVYAEGSNESVIWYYTINLKTGEIMSGVPIFSNKTGRYYADIYFQDAIGDLYLKIKLWEKDGNDLKTIYDEDILLCTSCRDEKFKFELSNINWQNANTITFNLSEEKENIETANIKIVIIDL